MSPLERTQYISEVNEYKSRIQREGLMPAFGELVSLRDGLRLLQTRPIQESETAHFR